MDRDKFKVILIGIVFDPEKRLVLIGKNQQDEDYSFLEGDLTYNEELDIGLKRVTKEKTGFKVHNLGAVYAQNCLDKKSEDKCKERLEVYFLCEATEGKEKPGKNVKELKWVKPSEVEAHIQNSLPARLKEYIMNLG